MNGIHSQLVTITHPSTKMTCQVGSSAARIKIMVLLLWVGTPRPTQRQAGRSSAPSGPAGRPDELCPNQKMILHGSKVLLDGTCEAANKSIQGEVFFFSIKLLQGCQETASWLVGHMAPHHNRGNLTADKIHFCPKRESPLISAIIRERLISA